MSGRFNFFLRAGLRVTQKIGKLSGFECVLLPFKNKISLISSRLFGWLDRLVKHVGTWQATDLSEES